MPSLLKFPEAFRDDLEQFRLATERFKSGAMSAAEYRSFRVPRGVYEQREADTYMLRARCPGGAVLPDQLRALARVAAKYGNGVLHVTTRQDIQVHRVLLNDLHPALVDLFAAGLSTKGGGGNTVRNITCCFDAGVCPHEAFDASADVLALTESLLPDPLSYELPRKYKLAFSGCPRDCAGATVNDVGFVARRRGDERGYAVYVGGGMGAESRVGLLAEEFVPATEIFGLAEAIKRVFDQHGNRKNRQKARIRFLVEQLGLARFQELYRAIWRELPSPARAATSPPISGRSAPQRAAHTDPGTGFAAWRKHNVVPQKQAAHYFVHVPLPLGEISVDDLAALAGVIERYGEGIARGTQAQNLVLRWVHESELTALHADLVKVGLAGDEPPILRNLVACTGASTCKLGICLSRGLARAVRRALQEPGLDLNRLGPLTIHISGCPNACGRHPVADLGLFGAARRAHGHLSPHYILQLGGHVEAGHTRLAEGKHALPARAVPAVLRAFLEAFQASPHCPDFAAFLADEGRAKAEELARCHADIPPLAEAPQFYYDWESEQLFSLAGRGPGECGAGVFDLIELDLQSAEEALAQQRWIDAVALAARALLVTRGQQARNEIEALDLFVQYFVNEHLVDRSAATLVQSVLGRLATGNSALPPAEEHVRQFVAAIRRLYESMDASLRFKPTVESVPGQATAPVATPALAPDKEVDFRGVVCPLNYVRTKMALDRLPVGAVLSVLLDEPGFRNVPTSVEKDGHKVLEAHTEGNAFRVLIRKA